MSKTMLRELNRLIDNHQYTDKQIHCLLEWAIDYNMQRAVRKVYNCKNEKRVSNVATQLVKLPHMRLAMEVLRQKDQDELRLTRRVVRDELLKALVRDPSGLVDEEGHSLPLNRIPRELRGLIDGFEQEEDVDKETGEVTRRRTKVKLTPIAAARNDALRHKGMFPKEGNVDVKVGVNLAGVLEQACSKTIDTDEVEKLIEADEKLDDG
jgi:hypothetical protein